MPDTAKLKALAKKREAAYKAAHDAEVEILIESGVSPQAARIKVAQAAAFGMKLANNEIAARVTAERRRKGLSDPPNRLDRKVEKDED